MPVLSRRFTAVEDAFAYLESFTNLERGSGHTVRSYRLDRMRALLDHFGHPDRAFKTIHLAGSKGKGSTAIYLASILAASGRKTGLYTSPHVSNYRERITLAGHFFPDGLYLELINSIAAGIAGLGSDVLPGRGEPTTFELLTLLGFLAFRESRCEWAVIETGIGGRLDATNVIHPEMCLLTPVELEHTELLGTTLRAIAGEKAGIIKEGVPVYASYQAQEVRDVFIATAALRHAPIRFLADEVNEISAELHFESTEMTVRWRDGSREAFHLAMPGDVQAENAALALLSIRELFGRPGGNSLPGGAGGLTGATGDPEAGAPPVDGAAGATGAARGSAAAAPAPESARDVSAIPSAEEPSGPAGGRPADARLSGEAVRLGLASARLPGRMEVIRRQEGFVVLDGAHTPVSTTRLLTSFRKLFPEPAVLIFGSVLGKDPEGMAAALALAFRSVIISTPGTFKASDPEGVHAAFSRHNPAALLIHSPAEALAAATSLAKAAGTFAAAGESRPAAREPSSIAEMHQPVAPLPILVTGSFYMVSEIRKLLL